MSLAEKIEAKLRAVTDALEDGQQGGVTPDLSSRRGVALPPEMIARIAAEVAEEEFRQRRSR
jgi:hypothetical protein